MPPNTAYAVKRKGYPHRTRAMRYFSLFNSLCIFSSRIQRKTERSQQVGAVLLHQRDLSVDAEKTLETLSCLQRHIMWSRRSSDLQSTNVGGLTWERVFWSRDLDMFSPLAFHLFLLRAHAHFNVSS